ncbi:MAG: hypothetical protein CMJ18_09610 [Phycisphaeraceae bacterium]|nr:hypothetical protein [Phycisphaeraceae bacterium]
MIEYLEEHVVYENPVPLARSRHAFFPGAIQLPSGELLALFTIGEALESADMTTWVSRSADRGRSWMLQGPLYDKTQDKRPFCDYFKPWRLDDGTLIALGYCFYRDDPDRRIAIEETGGVLPGEALVSFSHDDGKTWSVAEIIPRSLPEVYEIPQRSLQLSNGDVIAATGLFIMPDGTNPSGPCGVLMRSTDGGRTWDDSVRYYQHPTTPSFAWEANIVEMQPGRLVSICWAFDAAASRDLNNQVTISHDNGRTWCGPIDTGVRAQSATQLYLGGERLLSIHCHREDKIALTVRVIDMTDDRWRVIEEKDIWGPAASRRTESGQSFADRMSTIRFGQASLLRLDNGEILAFHWAMIEGQGMILSHRLSVDAEVA